MTPLVLLQTILDPGLSWCATVPGWIIPPDDRARLEMLAIAGQESDWQDIQQFGGPARDPWQFEVEACSEVLDNPASVGMAHGVCAALGVSPAGAAVYGALISDYRLAVAFARLYLWCDPAALPASEAAGWLTYLRTWRPGAPGPFRWPANYQAATGALGAVPVS